jgi:hypothetical protein
MRFVRLHIALRIIVYGGVLLLILLLTSCEKEVITPCPPAISTDTLEWCLSITAPNRTVTANITDSFGNTNHNWVKPGNVPQMVWKSRSSKRTSVIVDWTSSSPGIILCFEITTGSIVTDTLLGQSIGQKIYLIE